MSDAEDFRVMMRGLVRAAEFKEQEDNGKIWDDECRNALAKARELGWGENKTGFLAVDHVCDAINQWADMMSAEKHRRISIMPPTASDIEHHIKTTTQDHDKFVRAWQVIRMGIVKSCLLHRTVYGNEKPSQTKCPVHKGQWSGISFPGSHEGPMGTFWAELLGDLSLATKSLRDVGCRCDTHKTCSCNTGWNPDEHCGCLEK